MADPAMPFVWNSRHGRRGACLVGGQDYRVVEIKFLPEWLAEMLRYSAFLGWAAEHFESDSQNLVGIFLHNFVEGSGGKQRGGKVGSMYRFLTDSSVGVREGSCRRRARQGWQAI